MIIAVINVIYLTFLRIIIRMKRFSSLIFCCSFAGLISKTGITVILCFKKGGGDYGEGLGILICAFVLVSIFVLIIFLL